LLNAVQLLSAKIEVVYQKCLSFLYIRRRNRNENSWRWDQRVALGNDIARSSHIKRFRCLHGGASAFGNNLWCPTPDSAAALCYVDIIHFISPRSRRLFFFAICINPRIEIISHSITHTHTGIQW